jgi:hypothetical protein
MLQPPLGTLLMDQTMREKPVEEVGEFTFPGEGKRTVYLALDGSAYFILDLYEEQSSWVWRDVSETVIAAMDAPGPRPRQLDHNASAAFAQEVCGESY